MNSVRTATHASVLNYSISLEIVLLGLVFRHDKRVTSERMQYTTILSVAYTAPPPLGRTATAMNEMKYTPPLMQRRFNNVLNQVRSLGIRTHTKKRQVS